MDEGDQVNTCFLLLTGEEEAGAGPELENSLRWQVTTVGQCVVELCPQVLWRRLSLVECYSLGRLAT